MSAVLTLDSPVTALPRVTPRRAALLQRLGISSVRRMIEHFPRTYQMEAPEGSVADLVEGQIHTVRGEVVACDYVVGRGKPRFEATIEDSHQRRLALIWFHGHYWRRQIHPGDLIRVQGLVRSFRNQPRMVNPRVHRIEPTEAPLAGSRLRPIYPASIELKSAEIERIIADALSLTEALLEEFWDTALLQKRALIPRAQAYRLIHQPQSRRDVAEARRRLIYDELMLMQLGLAIGRRLRDGAMTAPKLQVDREIDRRIRSRFPFELTRAQTRAIHDILRDVQSGRPMNRLLQGDVGSGKTSVAVYAMLLAVANRMQAALLAPTEVLAEQHYLVLSSLLRGSRVALGLVTHRTRRALRQPLARDLAEGRIHIAIGTQALLQEDIEFANLGLVVIDEQHKLGVRQRATLRTKGQSPHYLVMTATPIPRTLALSYFADFDLSILDELPPGRSPIRTTLFRSDQSQPAWQFLRQQVEAGRQAYVVLPQIEDSEESQIRSVKSEFERLQRGPLSGLRMLMLHGQLPPDVRQNTMNAFRRHEADVLVATTVIEVGVDVPNATIMVIESAERFGLAQLHQLRGRVGRCELPGFCILISDTQEETALRRLQSMCQTSDGFKIAELDLQQRGPGTFFGTRQHGLPETRLADLSRELELLEICRDDARAILQTDPRLSDPSRRALRGELLRQFGEALALAGIG
ncbi:MAG: ATP-dependent DNA helicase RecG [Phycisphaerae bacterium]|nr:ATP-dependent DNA helicase RecG [Phycisphaerae bacterium]